MIDGDELSIFPDQTVFLARWPQQGSTPATWRSPGRRSRSRRRPSPSPTPYRTATSAAIFEDKRAYLERYAEDWAPWLAEQKATMAPAPHEPGRSSCRPGGSPSWPLAPTLRQGVGANVLIRAGDAAVLVDFPAGEVRAYAGEPFAFSFDIPRDLLEKVVADRAVDWSNALFLSCRFRAWRAGEFNEYVYNFLKSLSPERIIRAEAEARFRLAPPPEVEEIELDGYAMERWCPHRQADLSVFGEVCDGVLTCHLHGWQFDLATGRCLTAEDRHLRVRPARAAS